MFYSIKTRLILFFMLFLIIIEAFQLTIIYLFFNNAYLNQKKNTIEQAFDEINDDQLENTDVFSDITAVMQDYEATSNLYFSIIRKSSGKTIYSTNDFMDKNHDFISNHSKYNSSDPSTHIINGENSSKWLVLYGTIETDKNTYLVTIWTCYEAEFKNTIVSLTPVFLFTIVISCITGLFLAFRLANQIANPIKRIARTAQHIAEQDFSDTLPVSKKHDEISQLAGNINKMSEKLEHDMNALKEANLQLEEDIHEKSRIDQMRRQFLSNVSHELKTPLAIISSYAEMLKYEGEHINREEYLDVILDESSEMNKMVGSLLNLSRLEYAADHLTLSPFALSEAIQNLLETRQILFTQKEITLSVSIQDSIQVLADEKYLIQAFDNYLSNAVKYTESGKHVWIRLFTKDDQAIFQVINEADALPEEEIKAIWESFYKVDKSRKKDKNLSVGLGLYIVKTVIDAHHGTYGVENVANGICFSISLPLITK